MSVIIFNLFGCASVKNHKHATGSVVALDSSKEAHVCMDSAEVKQGDRLSLFQSICTTKEKKLDIKVNPQSRQHVPKFHGVLWKSCQYLILTSLK